MNKKETVKALVILSMFLMGFVAILHEMKPEPKDTSYFYTPYHIDQTE